MPDTQIHCESCRRKIGRACREVHRWIDEPVKMMGPSHRGYRHDIKKTPKLVKEMWDRKYEKGLSDITGDEAKEACIDHILLDNEKGDLPPRPSGLSEQIPDTAVELMVLAAFIVLFGGMLLFMYPSLEGGAVVATMGIACLFGAHYQARSLPFIAPAALLIGIGLPAQWGVMSFMGWIAIMFGFLMTDLYPRYKAQHHSHTKRRALAILVPLFILLSIVILIVVAASLVVEGGTAFNQFGFSIAIIGVGYALPLYLQAKGVLAIGRTPTPMGKLQKTGAIDTKEKRTYRCITCGAKIPKQEYEENEGQCDNCVAEDTVYAGRFPELGFE